MFYSILSLITAGSAFLTDRECKRLAREKLKEGEKVIVGSGRLYLMRAENRGFAKNRFENSRKLVVTVSTVVFAISVLIYAVVLAKPAYRTLRIGMGLLMGGAAGNVYDRLVRGSVTDFIVAKPFDKIIFNPADVFLLVGAIVTVLCDALTA